uniref:Uncharacterized protein n=1 Tax=Panagrolaimus davidi TaxID=227884 RepID=A0A914Q3Y2_9BILA
MSDSDEYEKIEDSNIVIENTKEEKEINIDSTEISDSPIIISKMEDSVDNKIQPNADIHINEIVEEDESGSESNDSYIYYTDEELYEREKFDAVSSSTAAGETHKKSVNVTNQKIKEHHIKSDSAAEKESAELDARLELLKSYRKWHIKNCVGTKSSVEELVKINNEIIQIQGFDDSETQTSKLQKALAAFKAAEEEYAELLKEKDKAEDQKDEQQHEHLNVLMHESELAVNESHMEVEETTKSTTNIVASNSDTSPKKQKNDYCNLINAYNIVRNHTEDVHSFSMEPQDFLDKIKLRQYQTTYETEEKSKDEYIQLLNDYTAKRETSTKNLNSESEKLATELHNIISSSKSMTKLEGSTTGKYSSATIIGLTGEPNMQKRFMNIYKSDTPEKSIKQTLLKKKNYMDERIKREKMNNLNPFKMNLPKLKANLLFSENTRKTLIEMNEILETQKEDIENKYNVAQEIADILENECKNFDNLRQKIIKDSEEDMKQKDATIARLQSGLAQAKKELEKAPNKLVAVKIDEKKPKESEQNLSAELAKAQQQIEYYKKLAADQAEALKNFDLAKSLEKQLSEATQKADKALKALGKREAMDSVSRDLVLKCFKDNEDYDNLAPIV